MTSFLVVISHYNAWSPDSLLALLDQVKSIPAGLPFRCRVVVNRAVDQPLELPERHGDVEVVYRENTGYNIGAWDHGWRHEPAYDRYLFLQEECQILRAGWLAAFGNRLDDPTVGLVGESLFWNGYSWPRADAYNQAKANFLPGSTLIASVGIREFLEARGIPIGSSAEHLQSLVWSARREVLERIDGFLIGRDYGEAIGSEVAASKKVTALGLKVVEVGLGPFRYVLHPQWRHLQASPHRIFFTWLEPRLPITLAVKSRQFASYLRSRLTGQQYDWNRSKSDESPVAPD